MITILGSILVIIGIYILYILYIGYIIYGINKPDYDDHRKLIHQNTSILESETKLLLYKSWL